MPAAGHGIDPGHYYEFDEFSSILDLSKNVQDCLRDSMKKDSEFLELNAQHRFFYGRTGIKHLATVKKSVTKANRAENKRKNKRTKKKR